MAPFLIKNNFACEAFDAYGCGESEKKKEVSIEEKFLSAS
jgi:hypothetical protein